MQKQFVECQTDLNHDVPLDTQGPMSLDQLEQGLGVAHRGEARMQPNGVLHRSLDDETLCRTRAIDNQYIGRCDKACAVGAYGRK